MRPMLATLGVVTVAAAVTSVATGQPASQRSEIARAVAAPTRTPTNVARDRLNSLKSQNSK